jgi:glycosyltransferase involved in cell wall biosynthesis
MKIRILFVIDNLQFGGGERVFAQIINGLNPEKYKIFLASKLGEQFYESIHNKDKEVSFFPLNFSKRINPLLIFELARFIKANEIDIVHGQGTRAEFYGRVANKIAGRSKYVSTIAMPVEGFNISPLRKRIYRLFDKISERFVDRFIVVSDVLRNMMINNRKIPSDKIIKIYNGIEIEGYRPNIEGRDAIRTELGISGNTPLIGAIGRIVWQKGFNYLIKSIPMIIGSYPDLKVMIVGYGPLKERLKELGSMLRVDDHLIFTGFRSDIKRILSALDILVIPSIREGFPMITLEGMAKAKPIVATRIYGIEEQIINGETGILVPSWDADGLARAIVDLLDNKQFAKNLGSNARKKVERDFSVEKMVSETEKVYQSLA